MKFRRAFCQRGNSTLSGIRMSLACSAGVLLSRANVMSSRSFFRSTMFDLELEWTVEVGGGERARRHLPEEAVERKNTPWLVARHFISRRWAGNQSNWVKLKTRSMVFRQKQTHVEPMSETVRKFCSSARKEMSPTKSPLRSQIWADQCNLYFPNENPWV